MQPRSRPFVRRAAVHGGQEAGSGSYLLLDGGALVVLAAANQGMPGTAGGIAATNAVLYLAENRLSIETFGEEDPDQVADHAWCAHSRAHEALKAAAEREQSVMGASLMSMFVVGRHAVVAGSGDATCHRQRGGVMEPVIGGKAAVLGADFVPAVDVRIEPIAAGDVMVLCPTSLVAEYLVDPLAGLEEEVDSRRLARMLHDAALAEPPGSAPIAVIAFQEP